MGNKYSKALDVGVLDNQGRKALLEMGCYGIGVGRTAAAAVEQCHDEKGIVWPKAIAPYQVYLMTIGKNPDLAELADGFYEEAMGRGIEVLYDDRKERPGVKFKDADLLGLPYQIVFGKNALETQEVELNIRQTGEKKLVKMSEVFDLLG